MVVCIITLYVKMAGTHLLWFRNCCQIEFITNTSMNFFACNVHLSFVCCWVVTCFNVLFSVVLCTNSNSTVVVICYFKLSLCAIHNLPFEAFDVHQVWTFDFVVQWCQLGNTKLWILCCPSFSNQTKMLMICFLLSSHLD